MLVCLSLGAQRTLLLAADHPDRVEGAVFIGASLPIAPGHPERSVYSFDDRLKARRLGQVQPALLDRKTSKDFFSSSSRSALRSPTRRSRSRIVWVGAWRRRPRLWSLHAQRDVAIARELRELVPDLHVDWLAQDPVTRVLRAEGERIHPANTHLANESRHIESESAEHDLHCFQAWRRMDEILLNNFMVFHDLISDEDYDLWIGDEAWELDYYLHENPNRRKRVCFVTVGGSGVGEHLLRRVASSFEIAKRDIPELRMIIVAGPRIDPDSLPKIEGLEVRPYVHNLYRHLAVCGVAIVQGGLTTSMELTASQRPFLYFPLRYHFEQNFHVRHHLDRYGAGQCMDFDLATPELIARSIADAVGKSVSYRPVERDGARQAATLLAELI